jgi:hypothetical protein
LAFCLLWGAAAGCKDRGKEVSEYPFFLATLNDHWEITLSSLRSEKPDITLPRTVAFDLSLVLDSMQTSYNQPNREAAIAKLKELYDSYCADMQTKINMGGLDTSLRPGVTPKDVLACVEKHYQDYQQFKSMVVVKK